MKDKETKKALRHFNAQIEKGAKEALKTMRGDGFDGVNYHKVFAIDLSTPFASAPSEIVSELGVGAAKIMGAKATDFPTVATASTIAMMQHGGLIGIGVENDIYNLHKSMNSNSNRVAKDTKLAFQKIEEAHQAIAWGTSETFNKSNLLGFYTHPHIVRSEFEPNSNGKIKWSEKTADEIIADITKSIRIFFTLNPKLREGQIEVPYFMPPTLFDILSLTKMSTDKEKSVLQHLKKFLPENGFNIKIQIALALATKDKNFVAIGDFRSSSISYNVPLTTEGLETEVSSLIARKNFISESRGLVVEKKNAAIIFEGA